MPLPEAGRLRLPLTQIAFGCDQPRWYNIIVEEGGGIARMPDGFLAVFVDNLVLVDDVDSCYKVRKGLFYDVVHHF